MRLLFPAILLALCVALSTCDPAAPPAAPVAPGEVRTAERVIARAISVHGMERWDTLARFAFTFRDRRYTVDRQGGVYTYSREFTDSTGSAIRDVLTNDGIQRYQDGQSVKLTDEDSTAYTGSVNSVRYFFMLPHGLQDPAVNAELHDTVTLMGEEYDALKVTFDREGGGSDYDDEYIYLFNRQTGELDFLAYNFAVEEGGLRFREAINKRRVGGILIQDYINYGVDGADRAIDPVVDRFLAGELPELSRIENTEVRIEDRGE